MDMILVTAANGHLGQHILGALLRKTSPNQVIAAARKVGNLSQGVETGLACRDRRLRRPEYLRASLPKCRHAHSHSQPCTEYNSAFSSIEM